MLEPRSRTAIVTGGTQGITVDEFHQQGFVIMPALLEASEVALLSQEVERCAMLEHPSRVMERDGKTVRAIHGSHLESDVFARLVRLPRFLKLAEAILDSRVYVHQFKINLKRAFHGEAWPWHQDYVFWAREDGMPSPRAMSISILLDATDESNGPLLVIPQSHGRGIVEQRERVPTAPDGVERRGAYRGSPSWVNSFVTDLKFTLTERIVAQMASEHGIVSFRGAAGSVMLFHANLAHASGSNMAPVDRRLLTITYNSVLNTPSGRDSPRPEFIAARDFTPLTALEDDALGVA